MPRARAAHRELALELAAAVGVERRGNIILAPRLGAGTIEDIVGRVVDDARVDRARRIGHRAHGLGVHRTGRREVDLRAVDEVVARRVEDDLRAHARDERAHRVRRAEIGLGARGRDDRAPALAEHAHERGADLPGRAEDEMRAAGIHRVHQRYCFDMKALCSAFETVESHAPLARYQRTVSASPCSNATVGRQPSSRAIFALEIA